MSCFYCYHQGEGVRQSSLWKALRIPDSSHLVISLTGAGGKTSVMYRLADEAASAGKKVIVTTSTHIFCPEDRQVKLAQRADEVRDTKWASSVLVVGRSCGQEKLMGLPEEEIPGLAQYADILLVEADGAKRLPLKIPGLREPVIIPGTDLVIGCAGLDSIGQSFKEACFRCELAVELCGKQMHDLIEKQDLSLILTSEAGTYKGATGLEYRIVLNKADEGQRIKVGCEVAEQIYGKNGMLCAITSFLQ